MKSLLSLILFFSFVTQIATAAEIPVKLIYKNANGSYATVAGTVTADDLSNVTITLYNGQLSYTTLPDAKGNFAIVFQYRGTQFEVTAWKKDRPNEVIARIQDKIAPATFSAKK